MKNIVLFLSFTLAAITAANAQVPEKKTKAETQNPTFACSMHPEQTSQSPGTCPKCGMELVKITEKEYIHSTKGSQARMEKHTKYVCSEDGSTSDKPGTCPKCGKERTKTDTEEMHDH